jgi:hypothetical protein
VLSKESPEYQSNGHYLVNEENWMSIWTYKNRNNIEPNNNRVNGDEGREMNFSYDSIESKPDFDGFDMILIYRDSDLDTFYKR